MLEKALVKLPKFKSTLPFAGGAVGFLAYELAYELEDLPVPKHETLPRIWFGIYDGGLVWDYQLKKLTVVAWSQKKLDDLISKSQNIKSKSLNTKYEIPIQKQGIKSNFTQPQYLAAIRKIKRLITTGYTFQVNLSQKFSAKVEQIDLLKLYSRLSQVNPAPFAGLLDAGDFQIFSSSPELLFRVDRGQIETWPIAGTRPRGRNKAEDKKFTEELKSSVKENAEHAMLVDLERNDLGYICEFGSVKVGKLAKVEKYARVQHLVSHVSGRLKSGTHLRGILRAVYPGGTITGCPKIETMKIIHKLEKTARGAYTGALGYVSVSGRMDFNILIRTLVYQNGELSWQVGGGIVTDSDPAAEYEETLHKAKALFETVLS